MNRRLKHSAAQKQSFFCFHVFPGGCDENFALDWRVVFAFIISLFVLRTRKLKQGTVKKWRHPPLKMASYFSNPQKHKPMMLKRLVLKKYFKRKTFSQHSQLCILKPFGILIFDHQDSL